MAVNIWVIYYLKLVTESLCILDVTHFSKSSAQNMNHTVFLSHLPLISIYHSYSQWTEEKKKENCTRYRSLETWAISKTDFCVSYFHLHAWLCRPSLQVCIWVGTLSKTPRGKLEDCSPLPFLLLTCTGTAETQWSQRKWSMCLEAPVTLLPPRPPMLWMAVEKSTLAMISSLRKLIILHLRRMFAKNRDGSDNSGDLDIDGRIILRC